MNILRFGFLLLLSYTFPSFCSDNLQFECKEFVYNGNIHQAQHATGKICECSAVDRQSLSTYFHGKIKNENGVLKFRLISRETFQLKNIKVEEIDLIDRTKPGWGAVYNDWQVSLLPNDKAQKKPNRIKEYLREKYKEDKPLIYMQIYINGYKHSQISFCLNIDAIPDPISTIKETNKTQNPTTTYKNNPPPLPKIKDNNRPYPQWIFGCVIALPVFFGLIYYYFKK